MSESTTRTAPAIDKKARAALIAVARERLDTSAPGGVNADPTVLAALHGTRRKGEELGLGTLSGAECWQIVKAAAAQHSPAVARRMAYPSARSPLLATLDREPLTPEQMRARVDGALGGLLTSRLVWGRGAAFTLYRDRDGRAVEVERPAEKGLTPDRAAAVCRMAAWVWKRTRAGEDCDKAWDSTMLTAPVTGAALGLSRESVSMMWRTWDRRAWNVRQVRRGGGTRLALDARRSAPLSAEAERVARVVDHAAFYECGLGRAGWWTMLCAALGREMPAGQYRTKARKRLAQHGVDPAGWTIADLDRVAAETGAADEKRRRVEEYQAQAAARKAAVEEFKERQAAERAAGKQGNAARPGISTVDVSAIESHSLRRLVDGAPVMPTDHKPTPGFKAAVSEWVAGAQFVAARVPDGLRAGWVDILSAALVKHGGWPRTAAKREAQRVLGVSAESGEEHA